MDVVFDVSFVLPAILFTFLAIILAASLLGKRTAPTRRSEATVVDDALEEEEEDVTLKDEVRECETEAEPEAVKLDESASAPVVEEIGVLEKQPEITESVPEVATSPVNVKEVTQEVLSEESAILQSEPPPQAAVEKGSFLEPVKLAFKLVSEPGFTVATEPEPVPDMNPEQETVAEAVPEAVLEPEPFPNVAMNAVSDPDSILKSTSKVAVALDPVPRASTTNLMPEPILDPLSKPPCELSAASVPEPVPDSAPAVAFLVDVQQMAAEPSPEKQEYSAVLQHSPRDAAGPSGSDGAEEPLKSVPRKLRTSQLEELMTAEELEEEQRADE